MQLQFPLHSGRIVKRVQEELIEAGGVPYSILRATQFFRRRG
ncbi:MAG TPA: hypothetical protein VGB13_10110 [Candidatus Krumholzibacteria bacterium]|jgi:hypothetical protein